MPENVEDLRTPRIEHLITWQEADGRMVIVGFDDQARPVYKTVLSAA
jgi:hypothetical protein